MNNKIDPFNYLPLEQDEFLIAMYPIPGIVDILPYRYLISNYGKIFYANKRTKFNFEQIKPAITQDGYLQVSLVGYNGNHSYKISRLVLYFFVGVPDYNNPSIYDANHKDYNRLNNRLSNLEWLLHEDNVKYSYCNMNIKINDNAIRDIYDKINNKNIDPEIIANEYNISRRTVIEIAHGGSIYKDKLERLGLENKRRHCTITNRDVIDIYKKCLAGISDIDIAKEYNIHKQTIANIRLKKDRYGEILREFPDISCKTNNKFTKEEAVRMHYEIINSGIPTKKLALKYNTSTITIRDIKFCINGYKYLQDEFGIIPPQKSNNNNKTTTDEAIKIYKMAKTMTSMEIHEKTGMSIDAINDIKFCRDGFEYLTEDFDLPPLPHMNPKGQIIGNKKEVKRSEDFGLKTNKFDITDALLIYSKLSNGATYRDICNEFKIHNTDVIVDIKYCRGGYEYLQTKYGLKPLID